MINQLLNEAKKNNIELEIFKEKEQNTSIEVYEDKIDSFDSFDITTYKITAIYHGKTICIKTENIDDIESIIHLIKEQSLIIDNDEKNALAKNSDIFKSSHKKIELDYQQITQDMISFNHLKKKYPNIASIMTCISVENKDIGIYNTLNTKLEDSNRYILYMAEVVMRFNGNNKTNYKYFYAKEYNKDQFYNMIEQVIQETIDKETATSIQTKKYNIVLDNRCVANLLTHFSFIFNAEDISKNKSILTNKLNEKIFSSKLTIVEDPQNENYIGKRLFDDEGTKTYYKEIVKDGVFITKLYNNKMAIKENTQSTGNSFNTRNMYIVPGKTDKEKLLKELNNGIYITNIEGLHAGINDTTGDISLQAEGYFINKGKKEKSLNMIILSTNIFELFNNIIDIGNDLEFVSVEGGSPSLLIENITIAGNK